MNRHRIRRREFFALGLGATAVTFSGGIAVTGKTEDRGLNLNAMILPVPKTAKFIDEDWYIWGGSMARTPDGTCHLLYARWPRELGHFAWLSHSEIAHAVADNPLGPYEFESVALPGN